MKFLRLPNNKSGRVGVMKAIRVVCLGVAVFLMCPPLFSQTANGRISGTVRDQTGGAIVGAAVAVTDTARGLTRNLTSDDAGAYLAPNLLPGTYTVRATFAGFQAWERTNILLEVGGDLAIDAVLQPGAQTQTVTVTEELPMVNTTSATLGGTLSNQTVVDLPVSGRNYQNLMELKPGIVLAVGNDSGGGGAATTNGLRAESSNEYLVEGLHGMDPYTGQSIINNIGVNGDAATILPVDAIQEFSTQFNPKAEYGFKAGSSVSVGLKSGTNSIHGTGLALFRNDALEARNFFNIQPAGQTTSNKVNANLRQLGATIGGPIKKDKLFFFLAYEQQNFVVGNPGSTTAPFTDLGMLTCTGSGVAYACSPIANSVAGSRTPDASNHIILACLALKAAGTGMSPNSLAAVGLSATCEPGTNYPNPSFFVPHGGNDHGATSNIALPVTTYYPNVQTNTRALGSVAKMDYQMNSQNSINGFLFKGVGLSTDGQAAANVNPDWREVYHVYALMTAGTWTWIPSSRVANSLRLGYASLDQPAEGVDTRTRITASQLGIPTGVTDPENAGLPTIQVNGFYTLGSRQTEKQGPMTSLEVSDQASYLLGRHAARWGGTMIREHTHNALYSNVKGTFGFGTGGNGVPAFLAGQNPVPIVAGIAALTTGLQSAVTLFGDPFSHIARTSYSLFLQDDFRIHPRVTLNLGVRYDYSNVPKERHHYLGSFDPNLGAIQEGIQTPAISNGDYNNFSPRLGVAWDVRGNGKTVIRAGGSIIYELITLRVYSPTITGNPTAWVSGCSVPPNTTDLDGATAGVQTIAANATSNCAGALLTPGGTRNTGVVTYSQATGTIGSVTWDPPAGSTIFPRISLNNCNPTIAVADVVKAAPSIGRFGAPCTINYADPDLRSPYVETWTVSIQHALRNNVVLDVAYVGNHGVKLLGRTDVNQGPSGPAWLAVFPGGANAGKTLLQVCNETKTSGTCQASSLSSSGGANAPSTLFTSALTAAKPFGVRFPYLQNVGRIWNRDVSNYQGLQVSLTARNLYGLSVNTGYTWSHALDIGANNTSGFGTDAYNNNLDYGRAASDLRHRFTTSLTYAVPDKKGFWGLLEGWKINSIIHYQTGRPWNPSDTRDFQGTNRGAATWNFFGNASDFSQVDYHGVSYPAFHPGGATTSGTAVNPQSTTGAFYTASDLAINTAACTANAASPATLQAFGCWTWGNSVLTPPALNTFGNVGKGMFTGPHYVNLDVSVTKRVKITERFSAEFRAETFNTLNHPNFAQGGGVAALTSSVNSCTVASCSFGRPTATPDVAATNAAVGSGGPRKMQLGVKILF